MKEPREVFAENLKRYMGEKGIDQTQITIALGVSSGTVSEWCNGRKYPRVDKLQKLADMFNVLLSDLMYEAGSRPSDNVLLSQKEIQLIDLFRKVPPEHQSVVVSMVEAAMRNQK